MMSNKKKVMFIAGDFAACGNFRVIQPVHNLQRHAKENDEVSFHLYHEEMPNDINSIELLQHLQGFDAIVCQRLASPKLLNILKDYKKAGGKLYIELDDALFNVHKSNPASGVWSKGTDAWNTLKEAISIADKLTFSTPELQALYQRDDSNSAVFMNALDLDLDCYNPENNRRNEMTRDKCNVMWAGSTSHVDSLKALIKPIKKLAKERDDFTFLLCSNPEFMDWFDIPKHQKQYVKHKPIGEWPPILSLADVSIAVVQVDAFNAGKSELKVLEAGIWGAPSVCTYVAPYQRFNKNSDGGNLLVYQNDPREWVENISKMIDNKVMRQEMSEKTLNTIKTAYNLTEINKKRIEFFKSELL